MAFTSAQASTSSCQVIQHISGKTQVCGQPQQVVALSPPLLDIMLALGVQPLAYAEVDLFTRRKFDKPEAQIPFLGKYITTKPINLGSRDRPSQELLLWLKPDLILGEPEYNKNNYHLLAKIAPTLLFRIQEKDDWQQHISAIARALGREERAKQVIAEYKQQITQTKAALAPIAAQQRRILVLGFGRLIADSFVLDPEEFVCGILQELGFEIITVGSREQERFSLSLEVLPQIETDVILVLPSGNNTIANAQQQWSENPILRSLSADRGGKVYFTDFQLTRIRGPIAAETFVNRMREILK
ncbi:MAG: Fe(3+)-citrate-binding protein YfmC [Chroococcidiopsis cubana SAG 39.79]|nr:MULTISPECIES: iron-siderophore ABC transporter substrate-binding protein [Chroococcidiopsis]MDZ4872562.1 Fe(3+)-citrate-binding protein YfmC [Chroococcidiopsis cubana SAG 39.79]PSB45091.1 iron-siderophore ABC transporter substrate-binding protein [Cyanosarcina cf. burmensis CCALA 770]PSB63060.1 iron-siderophore ABC transporter substrate-binding protein [Chroococcidiopsis cubana CCALA 043]RUT13772.1 Fe(3+)-citrate-binding protein YfmC [Chroococcidiopsis cubana SAG 39.79]